jgi:hypothetical protein
MAALSRRTAAIMNDILNTGSSDAFGINIRAQKDSSTGLGGNIAIENCLWMSNTSVDAFNILGGGIFGAAVTFGDTTPVTSSSVGGGLIALQDARVAGTALAKVLATDAVTISTTDANKSSALAFAGATSFSNTGVATFTNSNTGTTAGAAPYQYLGDVTNQKNLWVQQNENIGGVFTSTNPTAATTSAGAVYVPNGGVSCLNAYVTNTDTVGSLVTTNTTDTASSATSPNQFNGSVGFLKQTNFDAMANFNQDVKFNAKIYYGDGSVTSVKTAQNMIVDNIILLDGAPSGAGSDSGVAMGRYQVTNDTGSGDVVNDNSQGLYLSGTVASGSNSTSVINLGQTLTATQVSNLPGSWVKVVDPANTGVIMTRRIKSVTTAGVATIWANADQAPSTETTDAVTVSTAKDFTNVPTNTMTYSIYSRSFLEMVWVESAKRFRFGSTPMSANTALSNLTGLADLEASNIYGLTMNTAQINGASSGTATIVQLVNILGSAISNVTSLNGASVWSTPVQVTIADSSTTAVAIPGITATQGIITFKVSAVASGGSRYDTTIVSNGVSAAGPAGSSVPGSSNNGVSPNVNERVGKFIDVFHGKDVLTLFHRCRLGCRQCTKIASQCSKIPFNFGQSSIHYNVSNMGLNTIRISLIILSCLHFLLFSIFSIVPINYSKYISKYRCFLLRELPVS